MSIQWSAPALMIASLLAGVAFALTHHFFYRYWHGTRVISDSQQRWITRGGTAFAFESFNTLDTCTTGWSAKTNVFVPRYDDEAQWDTSVLLNCSLSNASYTLDSDFRGSTQLLHVEREDSINRVPNYPYMPSPDHGIVSYISIMDAFGHIMAGSVATNNDWTDRMYSTLVMSTSL
ncbi:hypothetical protein BJ546DRAFT_404129 [Cryomyces antarcticus]